VIRVLRLDVLLEDSCRAQLGGVGTIPEDVEKERGRRVGHDLQVAGQAMRGFAEHLGRDGEFAGLGPPHRLVVEADDFANAFLDQLVLY